MKKRYLLFALLVFLCLGYQNVQEQLNTFYIYVYGTGGTDCSFSPANPTIGLTDTVYFVHGAVSTTHTSYTSPAGNPPNMCQCNLNLANDTCGPIWFTALGAYPYNCNLHAGVGGTITVATVGINDPTSNESSKVFPNPFPSITTIYFNGFEVDRMDVFNLMGQRIKSLPIKNRVNQIELDLTGISNGVYFYRLLNEEGIIETKRLVKAN